METPEELREKLEAAFKKFSDEVDAIMNSKHVVTGNIHGLPVEMFTRKTDAERKTRDITFEKDKPREILTYWVNETWSPLGLFSIKF